MKKLYASLALILVMTSVAFAMDSTASISADSAVSSERMMIYPYMSNDYPEVLVMKGVAVDDEIKSALFLAVDRENERLSYKNYYMIIDGKSYDMELENLNFDKETQTAVITLKGEGHNLKLVIKQYQVDYRQTIFASGMFDNQVLNLRVVGERNNIYRIAYAGDKIATRTMQPVMESESIEETDAIQSILSSFE